MGQIVKRKKKGRPSKADLARRSSANGQSTAAADPERRRSLRRRNVRYNNFIDYDDYLDEFEEFEEIEEEEEGRKEKKLKLVLKINNDQNQISRSKAARGSHAVEDGVASSSEEDESEKKPLKKRRVNGGGDDSEGDQDSENGHGNDDYDDNNDQEERGRKDDAIGHDSVPGTPSDHRPNGLPLPDKKTLELILDKLQKKDTYGVYAESVDLEELPDYLDVIDHPMDFATVRKKLGNGSYASLQQFENDVFLICSNAMQYNGPETIYHKQARAIRELAEKKFQKLRNDNERSGKEPKSERSEKELKSERLEKELKSEQLDKELRSEQKTKSNFLVKKQTKKPLSRTVQEPIGSDFSSGAALANVGDIQNGSVAALASGNEKAYIIDGLVEGNSSLVDNNLDKAEELSSGKGFLSKFGRKSSLLDENRRATYYTSSQPVVRSESVLTTFDGEIKQLVVVGLQAEYSYARSLARFAASLGPVAWRVASQRIERALPAGYKFGRGWVGEYEPLPTSVLMFDRRTQKEPVVLTKTQFTVDARKGNASPRTAVPPKEHHVSPRTAVPPKEHHVRVPTSEGKPSLFRPTSGPMLEGKPSLFGPGGTSIPMNPTYQQQNLPPKNYAETHNKASKQVELNLPPSNYQHDADIITEKQLPNGSELPTSKPREASRTKSLLQPVPSKQLDKNGVGSGWLPNGKVGSSSLNSRTVSSSSDSNPSQMARASTNISQGKEQGLTDPVEAMRISAEKAQKQQKPSNQSSAATVMPSVIPVRNDSSNATVAAAHAWMSIGAGSFRPPSENSSTPKVQISAESLYNPGRQHQPQVPRVQGQFRFPPGMQFQPEKGNLPFQAFMPQYVHAGNEGQLQNRPMVLPQLVASDLSRFQMQNAWRGLNPLQPKQKQETLPPDLNIGFQSPGSPVKESSGVMVDSQQPDLALQL